jgi:2-(1,2-epoxy-1,2-dihydrophenyl)acetyl-CoA isomerase
MTTAAPAPELLVDMTDDGVLTLTLNRPDVLNSLTMGMMAGITASLKKAASEKAVKVVLLTAAGRAFCAGADLGDLQKRDHFNPLVAAIRRLEKPVIGAVNGLAAGAGASIVLFTDIKVCADSAKFINAFVKVGLVPDSGMTYFLPRMMGYGKALEHAWLAKPITAQEALSCGLVNRVVPAEQVLAEAKKLASELASMPPLALALTKRAINRSLEAPSLEDQMEYEAQLQAVLGQTKDHAEGVSAFLQKRPPQFKGE